ncbi:MAG: hypothetical protein H6Q42_3735, partial [Deltaproteobacteria bacterium]|nr:hypothetical protein [Deltaproteobacteria bacterium]
AKFLAEGVGFEPTSPFGETVFKTAAIDHSAIPPGKKNGTLMNADDADKNAGTKTGSL